LFLHVDLFWINILAGQGLPEEEQMRALLGEALHELRAPQSQYKRLGLV
jgi:hypothetical protein